MGDPAVQMTSRVVFSVVEQACDVLDTIRMHVAESKDIRTMVQTLDLLDDAEMVFEKVANTCRAGIAVAEAQGEPWWAFEAAISCLVEGMPLMQTTLEEDNRTSFLTILIVGQWKVPTRLVLVRDRIGPDVSAKL